MTIDDLDEMRPSDLDALSRKYRLLLALREDRDRGAPLPPRAVFIDLSTEFPGSLRELERLPYDLIASRIHALDAARSGGEHAPWMRYTAALHSLLRLGLDARKNRGRTDQRLTDDAAHYVGTDAVLRFVDEVCERTPSLRRLAVGAIAAHHRTTIESIVEALEPGFRSGIARDRFDPST